MKIKPKYELEFCSYGGLRRLFW